MKTPNPNSNKMVKIVHIRPTPNSELTDGALIQRIKKYVTTNIKTIPVKTAIRRAGKSPTNRSKQKLANRAVDAFGKDY